MSGLPTTEIHFQTATVDEHGVVVETRPGAALALDEDLGHGARLRLIALPGGTFMMGSPRGVGYDDERPPHQVRLAPFLIGQAPITQAQWRAVMGRLPPCRFAGDDLPVENVSAAEAERFCQKLSRKIGRACALPSEAQWEYACRGGTQTAFAFGPTLTTDLANYVGDHTYGAGPKGVYRHATTPAGTFAPNAFGLYDMHGNVWEWCADAWHPDYDGAPPDGRPWLGGDPAQRVMRGGSWHEPPDNCRSAVRSRFLAAEGEDHIGFRVALTA